MTIWCKKVCHNHDNAKRQGRWQPWRCDNLPTKRCNKSDNAKRLHNSDEFQLLEHRETQNHTQSPWIKHEQNYLHENTVYISIWIVASFTVNIGWLFVALCAIICTPPQSSPMIRLQKLLLVSSTLRSSILRPPSFYLSKELLLQTSLHMNLLLFHHFLVRRHCTVCQRLYIFHRLTTLSPKSRICPNQTPLPLATVQINPAVPIWDMTFIHTVPNQSAFGDANNNIELWSASSAVYARSLFFNNFILPNLCSLR